jgi:hypothetical protein
MSQTTNHLNAYITRLDEDLTTQIRMRADAERSLGMATEEIERLRRDNADAIRYAVAREEREHQRTREDLERAVRSLRATEDENNRLAAQLRRYSFAKIKEAADWLDTTSIEDMTAAVNAEQLADYGIGTRAINPLKDKIPMIKYVRNTWDLGLKEAKDIVDAWYVRRAEIDRIANAILDSAPLTQPQIDEIVEQIQMEDR